MSIFLKIEAWAEADTHKRKSDIENEKKKLQKNEKKSMEKHGETRQRKGKDESGTGDKKK